MPELKISLKNLKLQTPLITASGCAGFGEELANIRGFDFKDIGAFVTKSISECAIEGNQPIRIAETPCGMINSIGLQNKGLDFFLEKIAPELQKLAAKTEIIVSIFGRKFEEYEYLAIKLRDKSFISAVELNVSCPNHEKGGIAFGADKYALKDVVRSVKSVFEDKLLKRG